MYPFTKVGTLEGNHAHVDCIGDKSLVVHELVRREGGNGVEEELGGLLEIPDGNAVQTLVDLESIPPIPVSPLFNEAAGKTG